MYRTELIIVAAATALGLCVGCGSSTPHAGGSTVVTTASPSTSSATAATATASTTSAGTTAKSTATAPKACSVLTVGEVANLLGGTVTAAPGSAVDRSSECLFKSSGGRTVDVKVAWTVANEAFSVTPAKFAAEMAKYSGTAFSGAGDAAYVVKANSFEAFLKGDLEVVLVYDTSLVSPDDVTKFEQLAVAAAGRV